MFKQIGENIKFLRAKKNLSQAALGQQLKVTRQQIATYEKGDNTIPLVNVVEISKIFQIPIDVLIQKDLKKYSENDFQTLFQNQEHVDNIILASSKTSSNEFPLSSIDNYIKNIVQEELEPIKNLLEKIFVKIELTDLKYELNEEIKTVSKMIGKEKKENN